MRRRRANIELDLLVNAEVLAREILRLTEDLADLASRLSPGGEGDGRPAADEH